MADVKLVDLKKSYGTVDIIKGVSLDIRHGEFVVFVGPSGCGKSTLLRMISGLEEITGGDLYIEGRRVNDMQPRERGIAMVFQSYAIFPHMTVRENIGFGLTLAGTPRAENHDTESLSQGRRERHVGSGRKYRGPRGACRQGRNIGPGQGEQGVAGCAGRAVARPLPGRRTLPNYRKRHS